MTPKTSRLADAACCKALPQPLSHLDVCRQPTHMQSPYVLIFPVKSTSKLRLQLMQLVIAFPVSHAIVLQDSLIDISALSGP